jgi:hypothetical protein
MGFLINSNKILLESMKGRDHSEDIVIRDDNIKMVLGELVFEGVD